MTAQSKRGVVMDGYRTLTRRECGRCGAEVREGKRRHFCGEPYPLKATEDIREVVYVPQDSLRGAVNALDEVLRVVDGVERGEPFATEDMSLEPLAYIGDVIRRARGGR